MSTLARSVADYLAMRRGVGYALRQEGRLLADFVGYCQRRGITRVTTEAALGWATACREWRAATTACSSISTSGISSAASGVRRGGSWYA